MVNRRSPHKLVTIRTVTRTSSLRKAQTAPTLESSMLKNWYSKRRTWWVWQHLQPSLSWMMCLKILLMTSWIHFNPWKNRKLFNVQTVSASFTHRRVRLRMRAIPRLHYRYQKIKKGLTVQSRKLAARASRQKRWTPATFWVWPIQ